MPVVSLSSLNAQAFSNYIVVITCHYYKSFYIPCQKHYHFKMKHYIGTTGAVKWCYLLQIPKIIASINKAN